jgi:hypothetical protein
MHTHIHTHIHTCIHAHMHTHFRMEEGQAGASNVRGRSSGHRRRFSLGRHTAAVEEDAHDKKEGSRGGDDSSTHDSGESPKHLRPSADGAAPSPGRERERRMSLEHTASPRGRRMSLGGESYREHDRRRPSLGREVCALTSHCMCFKLSSARSFPFPCGSRQFFMYFEPNSI